MITKQIIENGILGLAIGDAIGTPFEYKSRATMKAEPCTGMKGYGTHLKPKMTWSDDTSMTLATMDGLAEIALMHDDETRGRNYYPIMSRFIEWFTKATYTIDGLFEIGGTCENALNRFLAGVIPVECGGKQAYNNGSGALMRMLPAVFFSLEKYGKIDECFIEEMSSLTHGHIVSQTACKIYAKIVESILAGKFSARTIATATKAVAHKKKIKDFDRLRKKNFVRLSEDDIHSTGYVVDTLEAALWCVCTTHNYLECVLKAVNLGGDTDTVATVAGSLAGLIYGVEGIPDAWIGELRGKEIIEPVIERFYSNLTRMHLTD